MNTLERRIIELRASTESPGDSRAVMYKLFNRRFKGVMRVIKFAHRKDLDELGDEKVLRLFESFRKRFIPALLDERTISELRALIDTAKR
jgi:hypothetical protein